MESRYEIRRTKDMPEGFSYSLVVETLTAMIPSREEIDRGGAFAMFNGFPFPLEPGDVVTRLERRRER